MFYLKAFGLWLLLLVLAVTGGFIRDRWMKPRLGDARSHQVETLILCAVFVTVIALFTMAVSPPLPQALFLGLFLLVLSLAFEFLFGRYVVRSSWSEMLADYNLFRGRLLPLLWLTVFLTPPLTMLIAGD